MPHPEEAPAQKALPLSPQARDTAWDALAKRRDAELDAGTATAVPARELLTRLRAELGAGEERA